MSVEAKEMHYQCDDASARFLSAKSRMSMPMGTISGIGAMWRVNA
jgi:hypothetical protein